MSFDFNSVLDIGATGIQVEVHGPDVLFDLEELDEKLEQTMMDIAKEARDFWETTAKQRLHTTRDRYVKAISMRQLVGETGAALFLDDPFANYVESGKESYSLIPLFLKSPKMRIGKVKMPRAVAASLPKGKKAAASRWMIIPLNVSRQNPFTSPKVFRTFTDKHPPPEWVHPGFPGVDIAVAVSDEVENVIGPRHMNALIEEIVK